MKRLMEALASVLKEDTGPPKILEQTAEIWDTMLYEEQLAENLDLTMDQLTTTREFGRLQAKLRAAKEIADGLAANGFGGARQFTARYYQRPLATMIADLEEHTSNYRPYDDLEE